LSAGSNVAKVTSCVTKITENDNMFNDVAASSDKEWLTYQKLIKSSKAVEAALSHLKQPFFWAQRCPLTRDLTVVLCPWEK